MGWNRGFGRVKEERENLSFFKIFNSADLSSESMRALPSDFMKNVLREDFPKRVVIRAQWGRSWEVDVSKNPGFMEKSRWNQFVSDNALGENEFVTFTHKGLMCLNVNIYGQNGKEIVTPHKPHTTIPFGGIKKEEGESSYKDVKKEDGSMGGAELEVEKKKAAKMKKRAVEMGESSNGAVLKKKKTERHKPSKKKKMKRFIITIRQTYLMYLGIPQKFQDKYIKSQSKVYKIHHSKGKRSWEVFCLVNKKSHQAIFSRGWAKLAREYPLSFGDRCTFNLVKSTEFVLTTKKPREEIIVID